VVKREVELPHTSKKDVGAIAGLANGVSALIKPKLTIPKIFHQVILILFY
jgi:hypothetical protein